MAFFKKKKKELTPDDVSDADFDTESEVPVAAPQVKETSGDLSLMRLSADVEKLKAQFSTFYELQKASTERFSNINEQIGGIRSMIMEREKESQKIEAKATQSIDLVKTLQPDKFMVDLRKMDSKIEALKANIESNENIMKNALNELKDMRNRMTIFKGMDQVIKMNDDVKKELMEIKKVQALVERHADKVETMFSEMQKRFSDFIRLNDLVKDMDKSFKDISTDFDSIKIKITDFAKKKEIENLIAKFEDFEKYVGNIVSLINKKFDKLEKELRSSITTKFDEADKLLNGFRILAQKTPDLDKYFNLLTEEAEKVAPSKKESEKVKELGQDEKIEFEKNESVISKVGMAAASVAGNVAQKIKKQ